MRESHSTAAGVFSTSARTTTLASTTALVVMTVIPILPNEVLRMGCVGGKRDLGVQIEHALPPLTVLSAALDLTLQEREHLGVHGTAGPFGPALDLLVEVGRDVSHVQG
jgi:hypothetical protein